MQASMRAGPSAQAPCSSSSGRRRLAGPTAALQQQQLPLQQQQQRQQQRQASRQTPLARESSHSRRLPALRARQQRRSPVIAPDIVLGDGEEQNFMDLFNYLLRQRIVFLSGYVSDKLATQIVGSLLALEAMDEEEEIRMYINSPGGQPYSIIGVLDTMAAIKPPIQTVGLGACYSYASLLLAAGSPGRRFAMKNTRIMMTQPMGGSQGDMYQISATVKELNAIYQLIARYYQRYTGLSATAIEHATCRDTFLTPEEAVQMNLIDDVIRGKGDFTPPPAIVRQLQDLGFIDRLSSGVVKTGRP